MSRNKTSDSVTDARKAKAQILPIWAFGWQPKLVPVANFIEQVEKGDVPGADDMKLIAGALRELFCHRDIDVSLGEVAKKLGLKRKQGRRQRTGDEVDHEIEVVERVLKEMEILISAGLPPAKAETEAKKSVREKLGLKERTLQSWFTQHRSIVSQLMYASKVVKERKDKTRTTKSPHAHADVVVKLPLRSKRRNENPG